MGKCDGKLRMHVEDKKQMKIKAMRETQKSTTKFKQQSSLIMGTQFLATGFYKPVMCAINVMWPITTGTLKT